jgi:hypothetical protein
MPRPSMRSVAPSRPREDSGKPSTATPDSFTFEGWLNGTPNSGNSEFGFQYSAKNNWYSPYVKTSSLAMPYIFEILCQPIHYLPRPR